MKELAGKKSDSTKIKAAERRLKVLDLRRAGNSYRVIADQVHVSVEQVRRDLNHSLSELAEQELTLTDELRAMEADRLNAMTFAYWDKAKLGDLESANFVMKVSDRRAKLLGLDKPAQLDLNQNITVGPDWSVLQGVIMAALQAYPDARAAVAQALMDLNPIEGEIVQEGSRDALD